jgi:hypothetical protein
MKLIAVLVVALSSSVVACSSDPPGSVDAPPGQGESLPTWQLADVQPLSPRTGQTYGLDTFAGKIVVVSLVEGY